MKILLINPPCGDHTIGLKNIAKIEPLNLELLGAMVGDRHEVRLVDMEVAPRDLDSMLREFIPDIVGVTSEVVHVETAKRALARARLAAPRCVTVVGGHHPTVWPQDFLDPVIDLVVRGEGTEAFRDICDTVADGGRTFHHIDGLMIREGDALTPTKPRPLPRTLDHQPMPDRSLTARYRHKYFYLWERRIAAVRSSVGCSFPCIFCSCRVYSHGGFIPRSPELLLEEIAGLEEEFVYLCDDHAFHDPERMWKLGEMLLSAGIKKRYFTYARVDSIVENRELFALWARAGLQLVMSGLESLDYEALKRTGKRVEKGRDEEALAILDDLGIGMSAGFLVEPHFEEKDFLAIDDYVKRHPAILLTEFTPLTPLPGTPLYRKVEPDLVSTDRQLYDLQHFLLPTETPPKQLYQLMRQAYARVIRRAALKLGLWRPGNWSWHYIRMFVGLMRNYKALKEAHLHIPQPEPKPELEDVG
ncbi:B12-binding domain-containing radical SAM protein [Kordiimonas lipolytica]|uniref:B12-binding domain-containing radical SAM protein n=1 Tax=Kordiimonas lipolytica TaxID=1662421 RepID=A0ABV8U7J8_9PROT|nr:cobalamin-dependent protein [Kordiimonas lipolytica]